MRSLIFLISPLIAASSIVAFVGGAIYENATESEPYTPIDLTGYQPWGINNTVDGIDGPAIQRLSADRLTIHFGWCTDEDKVTLLPSSPENPDAKLVEVELSGNYIPVQPEPGDERAVETFAGAVRIPVPVGCFEQDIPGREMLEHATGRWVLTGVLSICETGEPLLQCTGSTQTLLWSTETFTVVQ